MLEKTTTKVPRAHRLLKSLEGKLNWVSKVHEAPFRGELFGLEQLSTHAQIIARQHQVSFKEKRNRLLARLDENERILRGYNRNTLAAEQIRPITPAAEWLLDNFYLIEEQIQTARRHLPRGYSRELPRLTAEPLAGLPRIYALVVELISHVDAQIDMEYLRSFVRAYQTVTPLELGELWAIPIMLRLALIENLRRITVKLSADRRDRDLADIWANRVENMLQSDPAILIAVAGDMARAKVPTSSAFVAEFCHRLARLPPQVHVARDWLEGRLTGVGLSIEKCLLSDSQNQAADQVSISHTIASLRLLGATPWPEFVESVSVVDHALSRDPAGLYRRTDFATRDSYRHMVENLARHSDASESEVALKAISLAEKARFETRPDDRSAHVGFYLVGKGLPKLEEAVNVKWPLRQRVEMAMRKYPLTFYLGGITTLLGFALWWVSADAWEREIRGANLAFLICVSLICISQLAVAIINWLSALLLRPHPLPRMDFSEGIPAEYQTMVVVPTMLTNAGAVDQLPNTLELHYLANRDPHLQFALLTDFCDAPREAMPDDDFLVRRLRNGVMALNLKYREEHPNLFFVFHRPRLWNEAEGVWMGYERKRGKLAEFNALLRGHGRERFSEIVGDISNLNRVRFVITLDTDTQLPREAAQRLAATLAHPLNQARFAPETGIVVEGYSILQPRVGVRLTSAARSWYARLFAGDCGIDPYTRTVSDVYQDLFDEGSFIGKGIYDVDAFERAVQGRFPENTILSHDLIESVHARSALVSDVELYEDHPSRYNADVNRRHRWVRGDWQIGQWVLPRVPGRGERTMPNPLSALSRWKLFDNLRRSLVPLSLVLIVLCDWFLFPALNGLGQLIALTVIVFPALLSLLNELSQSSEGTPLATHLGGIVRAVGRQIGQAALTLAVLPYDAYVSLDAILRTLVRALYTGKRLLEWQTASEAERNARTDLAGFYRTMWIGPALAALTAGLLLWTHSSQLFSAIPLLTGWLLAPWIAWWISLPISKQAPELTERQLAFLGTTARRTWRFFENFVTEQENWLPPDNFQEYPKPKVAARTSPTNIGLGLLANLAACDFGYVTVQQLIDRTQNTLGTLKKLERHRGHFFNWYDTRTLQPLTPHYVSTVDSGNLAGNLLTLSQGLTEYSDRPIVGPEAFRGLRDTLGVLVELTDDPAVGQLNHSLQVNPISLCETFATLQALGKQLEVIGASLATASEEVRWWHSAAAQTCRQWLEYILMLAPWVSLLSKSPSPASANHNHAPGSNVPEPMEELAQPSANGQTKLARQFPWLDRIPTLRQIASMEGTEMSQLNTAKLTRASLAEILRTIGAGSQSASKILEELQTAANQAREFSTMDFGFLYDSERDLFSIGYNVTEHRRDAGFYDLLASESRLGSYVAIAQGQVPQKHWFSMGRLLASSRGEGVLVSWSGSMFEYLMPLLIMPTYENTLLDQTSHGAVRAQIDYGKMRDVPWGISESGYNVRDTDLNYQYRAFGVPGLGFKRGLGEDLVVAPYASVLALMVAPREACINLLRLESDGRRGRFGFYEAVDYTPSRMPPNESSVTIRSFMAHHQGMSLLSLLCVLLDHPMQRRFMSYPPLRADALLLQERVPKTIGSLSAEQLEPTESRDLQSTNAEVLRIVTNPNLAAPEVHLLSNGHYHVLITHAGGGYSRWDNLALTRWREDATRDCWGSFCYVRELDSGEFWSMAFQPTLESGDRYEAIFGQARAEFRQRHGLIETHTEISVSPEDDVELRRVTLTNHSGTAKSIEITTYAEVVLVPQSADTAHPAFSNLFVQTEFQRLHSAVLCTRRARSKEEQPPWLFHLLVSNAVESGELSFETDRAKFIGRGRNLVFPAALDGRAPLSNTEGAVLDPIVSLRRNLVIPAEGTIQVAILMGFARSRENAMALVEKYHNLRMADRLMELAWTHSQVMLHHLDATEADAQLYGRMAGALVFANPIRRANSNILRQNRKGQSGLWSYGISGDAPIVLVRFSNQERFQLVKSLIKAHAYWRTKGLSVDLVFINEDTSVYRNSLQEAITTLINSSIQAQMLDKPGGIFVRRADQIPAEDRILLQAVARLHLSDEDGTLEQQFQRRKTPDAPIPELKPSRSPVKYPPVQAHPSELLFFNGLGGFRSDGKEYIITLNPAPANSPDKRPSLLKFSWWPKRELRAPTTANLGLPRNDPDSGRAKVEFNAPHQMTPAPWSNVLANERFGTVLTESGGAYTWFENSHEFRLTPWHNDPLTDVSGEALYLRDEETGEYWSPTPLPAHGLTPYVIRHGFGYTLFEHTENGIESEVSIYVAMDAPIKFTAVKLKNLSGRPRRISLFGYWEWVLGEQPGKSALHVQTEIEASTSAMLARNRYSADFADWVAFVDADPDFDSITGDRREFLGRNGTLANPASLKRMRFSGKTGAGIDPCAAVQVLIDLPGRVQKECCFRLGAARNLGEAQEIIRRFRSPGANRAAFEKVKTDWDKMMGAVSVETPDRATNFMANGWLMYQTLSSRMWGRSGFYQSGGAFGFRDQLQDAMALLHTRPDLLRQQLLLAAEHQFREGDVQHWWHPPSGRGVRTRISDDYLWLPYATCRYAKGVNDFGVLDERIHFLEGRGLRAEEESYYELPNRSDEQGTLYEHCVRAIQHGLRFGKHGLPLIGSGDWNDGFNLVGIEGRGESVWLGFFLIKVLREFADLAEHRKDDSFAETCRTESETLAKNIEASAWDGKWYRRAYFDTGEPLGSQGNSECQIDSLPQSWAVMAAATNYRRARRAMREVERRLVRREGPLIQLFDPPFDKSPLNPGYIKGYVPGVRENGGQYTHAAIWAVMALAQLRLPISAWEQFKLLNPINHGDSPAKVANYKVEPYVVAADVYAAASHFGRGGWTWYTGSAGWMYRLVVESLLGLNREGNQLRLKPCVPPGWKKFAIHYRYGETLYHIMITQNPGSSQIDVDGHRLAENFITLVDDHREHYVNLHLGKQRRPRVASNTLSPVHSST